MSTIGASVAMKRLRGEATVPDAMLGLWRRRSIEIRGGFEDLAKLVLWLQTASGVCDMRFPDDRIDLRHRDGLAACTSEELIALDNEIVRLDERIDGLLLRSPITGTWISSDIEFFVGSYVRHGEAVGLVADLSEMIIRATADQNVAATLIEEAELLVEIRGRGRPEVTIAGTLENIYPAGQQVLPAEALGRLVPPAVFKTVVGQFCCPGHVRFVCVSASIRFAHASRNRTE